MMNNFRIFPVLGTLLLMAGPGQSDMQWTEVMKTDSGAAGFSVSTTKRARKDAERSETTMKMGPLEIKTVELTRCDLGQKFQLLPEMKMYTAGPLEPGGGLVPKMPSMGDMMGGMMGGMPAMPGAGKAKPRERQNGTAKIEIAVQDLGKEKIAGFDTTRYQVTMKTTATGCAGKGTVTMQMEIWVAAGINHPAPCLTASAEEMSKSAAGVDASCDVKTEFVGDMQAMKKAFSGLQMKMKLGMAGKGTMTKEVTMLSQAEQPADAFEVPTGWKKVTEQEFNQARSQAMMKAMTGG